MQPPLYKKYEVTPLVISLFFLGIPFHCKFKTVDEKLLKTKCILQYDKRIQMSNDKGEAMKACSKDFILQ